MTTWPFSDPKNLACITVKEIVLEGQSILRVTHDLDDGGWQFLTDEIINVENAMVLGLEEIYEIDESIAEISNLPLGWKAIRKSIGQPWVLSESEKE